MTTTKQLGRDLTQGPIMTGLLLFAIPIVLTNLVQQLYSMVDLMVIGKFVGSIGTVGVNTGGEIADLVSPVAMGFSSAGQIYIAQLAGAKSEEKIKRTVGTLLGFMISVALALAVIAIAFSTSLLEMLNCPSEAMSQARDYMIITQGIQLGRMDSGLPQLLLADFRHINGTVVKQVIGIGMVVVGMGICHQQRLVRHIGLDIGTQIIRGIRRVNHKCIRFANQQVHSWRIRTGAKRFNNPGIRLYKAHMELLNQRKFCNVFHKLRLQCLHGLVIRIHGWLLSMLSFPSEGSSSATFRSSNRQCR